MATISSSTKKENPSTKNILASKKMHPMMPPSMPVKNAKQFGATDTPRFRKALGNVGNRTPILTPSEKEIMLKKPVATSVSVKSHSEGIEYAPIYQEDNADLEDILPLEVRVEPAAMDSWCKWRMFSPYMSRDQPEAPEDDMPPPLESESYWRYVSNLPDRQLASDFNDISLTEPLDEVPLPDHDDSFVFLQRTVTDLLS